MTYASTLDDIVRGISATAPPADQEALIELHGAQQQLRLRPQLHLFRRYRSERKIPADAQGECLPHAA